MESIFIRSEKYCFNLTGKDHAPVVVFSNSLGTTHKMWTKQIVELAKHYRVLTYDTRGHGQFSEVNASVSLDKLGNDVLNLLDALDIETVTFCGISMGGLIGQWLGVYAGSRLDKLVLCNTAAKIGQADAWLERASLVRSQGMEGIAKAAAGRWFSAKFAEQNPEEVAELLGTLSASNPEGYAACCEAIAHADLRNQICSIETPTWIIAGMVDPVTTLVDANAMAREIVGSHRIDLEASHLSNIEASQAFNTVLSKILLNP